MDSLIRVFFSSVDDFFFSELTFHDKFLGGSLFTINKYLKRFLAEIQFMPEQATTNMTGPS